LSRARILILENELVIAEYLATNLRHKGYEVMPSVASGEKAIALIREIRPDLILLDLALHGTSGNVDTARSIREEFAIPVVYLSAYSRESLRNLAALEEARPYVCKPFPEEELFAVIENALANKKKTGE
jgi:DNA-binding response OmpR family regulator